MVNIQRLYSPNTNSKGCTRNHLSFWSYVLVYVGRSSCQQLTNDSIHKRKQNWSLKLPKEKNCPRPVMNGIKVWLATNWWQLWGRYHGGRRPSSDDTFHSPTVFPPSALDKPSTMKRYHSRRTCSHTLPRRSPTMVTLQDTRFVECRWWNDGWTVKTVVTWRSSASMIPAPGYTKDNSRSAECLR